MIRIFTRLVHSDGRWVQNGEIAVNLDYVCVVEPCDIGLPLGLPTCLLRMSSRYDYRVLGELKDFIPSAEKERR